MKQPFQNKTTEEMVSDLQSENQDPDGGCDDLSTEVHLSDKSKENQSVNMNVKIFNKISYKIGSALQIQREAF